MAIRLGLSTAPPTPVGDGSMPDRTDDYSALLDRVQHAIVADAGAPETLETTDELLAHRLGLNVNERDRLDHRFTNGRR
jgi:hypothetical protein